MTRKILVLGAGLVARPLVSHLLDRGFHLTVATRTVGKAEALLGGHENGRAVPLDLENPEGLDALISETDLAISLVPYTWHVAIARRCLEFRKPMVTTSYVSNEMRALGKEAQEKGVLILNEIGLDPGIDHMSAMRVIHAVQAKGGKVTSFRSYCGGLPAPSANDNPWGYKFSWSPRGVLLAGRNAARFLDAGNVVEVEPDDLFTHTWPVPVESVGTLEGYPNRDSLQYTGLYGLAAAQTMFRGTLRYPGWCPMMKALVDLGWLDLEKPPARVRTLGGITGSLVGVAEGSLRPEELKAAVAERLGLRIDAETIRRLEWAGLFSNTPRPDADTRLDVLSAVLQEKLAYQAGEPDMIVLLHAFQVAWPDGTQQAIRSTLVDFGVPEGDSAMARTVSLPAAIASRLILDGAIQEVGVRIPVEPEIYNPVLDALEEMEIVCKEDYEEPRQGATVPGGPYGD